MNTKVTFVKQIAPILGIRLSKTISNRILVSVPVFYEKKIILIFLSKRVYNLVLVLLSSVLHIMINITRLLHSTE